MGNYCCNENSSPNQVKNHSTRKASHVIVKNQINQIDSHKNNNKNHEDHHKLRNEESNIQINSNTPSINQLNKTQQKIIAKHGPQNYQSLKYLGRGTFGDVVLAQDKQTSKQYAMKIIDKSKIKELNLIQCKMIKDISHRDILVTIRETFQNQNKIYIIMEYLNKGDIYFYLKKKQVIFNEEVIKSLLAEIIYGVEILHSYGIIYRELKPENILVTNDGHVKLTDYGLSKMLIEDKKSTCTFVGALEYMAPQAISGNYGKEVDLWSIGILIYELKFQKNPFASIEHTEAAIIKNIQKINIQDALNQKIGKVSQQLRDLLIGLLQKSPKDRLTIQQVKKHPFFKQINWQDIKQRKNYPPLKQFIEKNDHIRFRDPTNESQISHRVIKFTGCSTEGGESYKTNLYEFRTSE